MRSPAPEPALSTRRLSRRRLWTGLAALALLMPGVAACARAAAEPPAAPEATGTIAAIAAPAAVPTVAPTVAPTSTATVRPSPAPSPSVTAGRSASPTAGPTATAVPVYDQSIRLPSRPLAGGELSVNSYGGNVLYEVIDLSTTDSPPAFGFIRNYNSNDPRSLSLGPAWRHSWERMVRQEQGTSNLIVTGPDGRPDRYTPLPDGSFRPPPGIYAQLVRQPDGRLTVTQPSGTVWSFSPRGDLVGIHFADGHQSTVRYDVPGRPAAIGDPRARGEVTLEYDKAGRLSEVRDWLQPFRSVRYAYDGHGRLASVIDAGGGQTRYTYHGESTRLESIIDARNVRVVLIAYGADGRATWREDASRQRITFTHVRHPDGTLINTTSFPPSGFDPSERTTTLTTFSATARVTRTETHFSRHEAPMVEEFAYDAALNPVGTQRDNLTVAAPVGTRRTSADPVRAMPVAFLPLAMLMAGWFTTVLDAATNIALDRAGRAGRFTTTRSELGDPLGIAGSGPPLRPGQFVWHVAYDAANRPTQVAVESVADAVLGPPLALRYDAIGNLVELSGAGRLTTRFQYDGRGLLTAIQRDDGLGGQMTHDDRGQPRSLRLTTADGTLLWGGEFAYDGLKRLRRVIVEASALSPRQRTVEYASDAQGQLTAYERPAAP